jgi:hypothetical protein
LKREEARGLRTAFFKGVEEAEFKSADGIYIRKRATYKVDLERLSRVPDRVVRGLFHRDYGRRLPNEYGVRTLAAEGLPREASADMRPFLDALLNTSLTTVGSVFAYSSIQMPDDPNATMWLTAFYRRVFFLSMTMRLEDFARSRSI